MLCSYYLFNTICTASMPQHREHQTARTVHSSSWNARGEGRGAPDHCQELGLRKLALAHAADERRESRCCATTRRCLVALDASRAATPPSARGCGTAHATSGSADAARRPLVGSSASLIEGIRGALGHGACEPSGVITEPPKAERRHARAARSCGAGLWEGYQRI